MIENRLRLIGYLILFAINALLFFFLHSHFHFVVLIIMLAAPVFSIATGFVLKRQLDVAIEKNAGNNARGLQNEECFFTLRIKNPTFFMSLDAKLSVKVENTFLKTAGNTTISVPIYIRKGYEISMPIKPSLPGIVRITVTEIKIKDLMGFIYFRKRLDCSSEIAVLPARVNYVRLDGINLEQGILESEESTKKGNDFSDVQEIREYIPGDKLMSIHWKLSAKRDLLMVKDRSAMSDRQIIVLTELCDRDINALSSVLVATYSVVMTMLEDNTNVRLLYWSSNSFEYRYSKVNNREELDFAFEKMYYEQTYAASDEAACHMPDVYPEVRAYIHISAPLDQAVVQIKENC